MSPKLKDALSTVYAAAIAIACMILATLCVVQAWSERTRSKGTATAFAFVALLFAYFAFVLMFQTSRNRQYQQVIATLGFVPLDWKKVPFNDLVLRAIFRNRKEAFVSGLVHGDSGGTHFYLFNWAPDTAWWSKRRTTLVFQPTGNIDERSLSGIIKNENAELGRYGDWCMIQARREIQPGALRQWIESAGTLCQRRYCPDITPYYHSQPISNRDPLFH